jgi:hypothetical protein
MRNKKSRRVHFVLWHLYPEGARKIREINLECNLVVILAFDPEGAEDTAIRAVLQQFA